MNMMRNLFGGGGQGGGLFGGLFGNFGALFQKIQQFAQNPIGALLGLNVDLPQNVRNNPEATVNYLRNSGQISNEQFNQWSQWANQLQNFLTRSR